MNTRTDSDAKQPIDTGLAEFHEALLAGEPPRATESDPDMRRAQQCLKLFERVRRQSRGGNSPFDPPTDMTSAVQDPQVTSNDGIAAAAAAPRQIGRFLIRRRIGEGGFGIVFEAVDPDLGRTVALKVPRPETLFSETGRSRFLREAEAAALLNHPHVVPVYEVGQIGSLCYIVQAYCDGPSLAHWLSEHQGAMAPTVAARLAQTLAGAVGHAHSRGVLHRDIKPSNILFEIGKPTQAGEAENSSSTRTSRSDPTGPSPGELADLVRLTDFGLARLGDGAADATRTGAVVGTPSYMAPEQAEGQLREVGTASDIYSLGAVLYELLTRRPPFLEPTLLGTLRAVREDEPQCPLLFNSAVPPDLAAICLKCLEKDPQQRYATAGELAEDLERFLAGDIVSARRATRTQRTRRWCHRNRALASLGATVAILVPTLIVVATTAAILLARARDKTLDSLDAALVARDRATRNEELALRTVYDARLAHGRAERRSGQIGQRVEALAALSSAARLIPRLGLGTDERHRLRNEVIACLPLVDLKPDRQWPRMPPRDRFVATDSDMEYYAHAEEGWRAILVYRMDDGQLVNRLPVAGEFGQILKIRFSPNGEHLAAWCRASQGPYTIQVWRVASSGRDSEDTDLGPVVTMEAMSGGASRPIDFSPDGRWLAAALPDGPIALLPVPGFELQQRIGGESLVEALRFDPASQQLAVARDGRIDLLDLPSGTVRRSVQCKPFVYQLAFSPDGSLLAAACSDKRVRLWQTATGESAGTLIGHGAQVTNVAFHPRAWMIATTSYDKTTRLWDIAQAKQLLVVESDFTGFSRDGRWMGGGEARFQVVLPEEHQVLPVPQLSGSQRRLSVEPAGRLLTISNGEQVVIVDLFTGQVVASQPMAGYAQFSPDGKWLMVVLRTGLHRFPVRYDPADDQIDIEIGPGEQLVTASAGRMAASQDGATIALIDRYYRPKIVLHDVPQNSTRILKPHHTAACWLSLSPDGQWLATGAWHGRDVKIWDAAKGELHTTLPAGNAQVCFSPTGKQLVVDEGSHYSAWRVSNWEAELPRTAKSFGSVPGPIAFSPDGSLLAILDSPRHVRLLDAATFKELASFKLTSEQFIVSLVFDPQSTRLIASTTASGTVHVWDLLQIHSRLRTMGLDWATTVDGWSSAEMRAKS